jgi:uncharacterized protein
MKVAISGSSGLIGTALVAALRADQHEVVRLVRRSAREGEAPWDPDAGVLDAAVIDGCDAVINLSGAGIGDRRWTDDYRRELLTSRTLTTGLLARTIAEVDRKPSVFLSGSAIGVYGPCGDEELSESSPAGSSFLADLCVQWEEATAPAEQAGVRTVHLRTGIVLSAKGGALKKQLPLFKLGVGGKFGSGRPWQSWIHIDDEVGAIKHLLTSADRGPVNLTAPSPVRGADFAKALGKALNRPSFMPVPAFGPRLLLGRELADALLFTGQKVLPAALQASGYQFRYDSVGPALTALVGK